MAPEANDTSTNTNRYIPDHLSDVSLELVPLYQDPDRWLPLSEYRYETQLGSKGVIHELTPEYVTFRCDVRPVDEAVVNRWQQSDYVDEANTIHVVDNREQAQSIQHRSIWIETDNPPHLYEHIPFGSVLSNSTDTLVKRAQKYDELTTLLDHILSQSPEWESLYNELDAYTDRVDLTTALDEIDTADFDEAIDALTATKDQYPDLSLAQQRELVDALATIQNMQPAE
jgi:hypothetical protein